MRCSSILVALAVAVVLITTPRPAEARTELAVPVPYGTIQRAIERATDGDVVTVAPGLYTERIDFLGKNITVRSATGPERTILAPSGRGSAVTMRSFERRAAILEGFTITGGTGSRCRDGELGGGGVFIVDASPTIRGNIFRHNSGRGAAIYALDSGSRIADNSFVGNVSAGLAGGAVYLDDCVGAALLGNTFDHNAAGRSGGGIAIANGTAIAIEDNRFLNNSAGARGGTWHGGAVALWGPYSGEISVRDNSFRGNTASALGGAVAAESASRVFVESNEFIGNSSGPLRTAGGGALSLQGSRTAASRHLVVRDNLFERNTAVGHGGALRIGEGTRGTRIEANRFRANRSGISGGAVELADCTTVRLATNVFERNLTQEAGGGVRVVSATQVWMNGNVFFANGADAGAAVAARRVADSTLVNSVLWSDFAGPVDLISADPELDVTYCLVQGGYPGNTNFDLDPDFVDAPRGDFHLKASSPCIDAGTTDGFGLADVDLDGEPRVRCGRVDVGVDETLPAAGCGGFVRGDCNADSAVDIADQIVLLQYLFSSGANPACADGCDASDDGVLDVADAITGLAALFQVGAPGLPAPYPECGEDPTADALTCSPTGICP